MERKSNRNQIAGELYEQEIVDKINAIPGLPKVGRSADLDVLLDSKKVDIVTVDEALFEELALKIQVKTNTKHIPYMKILSDIKINSPGGIPVILHKKTRNAGSGRFLSEGAYAIMNEEDFMTLLKDVTKYKKGYDEFSCYFDSVHPNQQKGLHERLQKLGL